jgi:hypothetical protein
MSYKKLLIVAVITVFNIAPAHAADQAQARQVALLNNCTPKKITVYQQSLGSQGETIYRIDCNMPKASDDSAKAASALLVSCDESICQMLRPLPPDTK